MRHPYRQEEVNRQIAADNKLLKEIKARVTRHYNWTKAETEKTADQQKQHSWFVGGAAAKAANHQTGHIRVLQESAALFNFLNANGICSMQQFHEKIFDLNPRCYDLRGEIVKTERRSATLAESSEMWK